MNKEESERYIMNNWIKEVLNGGEKQIKIELEVHWKLIDTHSKLLDRVTKGRMSKPNYTWKAISDVLDEIGEEITALTGRKS